MNTSHPYWRVVSLVLSIVSVGVAVRAQPTRPLYVPGEVLVKLRSPGSIGALAAQINARVVRRFRLAEAFQLQLPANLTVDMAVGRLRAEPAVEFASPNFYRYVDGVPSDPQFDQMWGLNNTGQTGGTPDADIDAPEAWEVTTGSEDVVVAVIDSGADLSHPDLAANIWVNPGEDLNGNGKVDPGEVNATDDDGNGFVDDFVGWDFSDGDNDPSSPPGGPCMGHGTHTAGTVGAVGDNGIGVTGVSQKVKLMILKTFKPLFVLCSASDADLLDAIDYTTLMGVKVSSNSWGGGGFSEIMRDTIRRTRGLFVVAAGNGGLDGVGDNNDSVPGYPASFDLDNIVAVAATDHNDRLASFSNYGPISVDLAAPGVNILSTLPGGYGSLSGTSMSTPHVSGAAALLLAQDPTYTVNELKDRLLRGVDVVPALKGRLASNGRLNARGSLTVPQASTTAVSVEVAIVGSSTLSPGDTLVVAATLTNNATSSRTVTAKLFIQAPSGKSSNVAGPGQVSLAAAQTRSAIVSIQVRSMAPSGTYLVIGQVNNVDGLDEDLAQISIHP